jgi:L-prolyl-PCP dehydrogenase
MDFDLDAATAELRDAVAEFARGKLGEGSGTEDDAEFRRRWLLVARQGLAGSAVPAEFGGGGVNAVTAAALMEGLGYGCGDMGLAFSVAAHLFACLMPVVAFGTDEQRRRWLPGLCSGELIAAHAITEPESGSDALHLRTTATRARDRYLLNGEKCFVTNAPVADVFIIQAVTLPGAGYFGLSSFLVSADNPGLHVGPRRGKIGLRGSPTADVRLDGCVVPAGDRLGAEGGGASVFSSSMSWERTCLFAGYLGAMRRLVEGTISYAKQRRQFGEPIGGFQAVSHRIVDMTIRLDTARLLLYRAAVGLDRGSEDEIAPAMAKLVVSEAAVQIGLDAIQLRGALGILDGEAERFLRDALPSRIFSGTSEIQKNNIARALGLSSRRPARRTRRGEAACTR